MTKKNKWPTVHVRPHAGRDETFCGKLMPTVDGVPLERYGEATCSKCATMAAAAVHGALAGSEKPVQKPTAGT